MKSLLKVCQCTMHIIAILLILSGAITLVVAICQPQWMVAVLDSTGDDFQQHYHGLIRDCANLLGSKKMICSIIQDWKKESQGQHEHGLNRFEHMVLMMLVAAVCSGFMAFLSSIVALISSCSHRANMCARITAAFWTAFVLFAALLSIAGVSTFGYQAELKENQMVFFASSKVEQKLGSAFWLAVYGTATILAALIWSFAVVGCLVRGASAPREEKSIIGLGRGTRPRPPPAPKHIDTHV